MIAVLLFVIGLVAVLVSIALIGFGAPDLIAGFNAASAAPSADMLGLVADLARGLSWAVTPIVGGLVLMGLARIIMLLGAINRSLRGMA